MIRQNHAETETAAGSERKTGNGQEHSEDLSRVLPVIMAGGEGRRLLPMTETVPKPLLPVGGISALERLLALLAETGFSRAVITVRYLGDMIEKTLGDTCRGVRLSYLYEEGETPLGTAGGVRAAAKRFPDGWDTLLILSGDAVTNADFSAFYRFHRANAADASLLSVHVSDPSAYGLILADGTRRITGFREKPSPSETVTDEVNTGIYLLERTFLRFIPETGAADFGSGVFPHALSEGARLYAFLSDAFWCDVGSFAAFRACSLALADGKKTDIPPHETPSSRLLPPALRGNCVGKSCFLHESAVVRESVLFDRVTVEAGAAVLRAVLCSDVKIGRGATVGAGSVIGEGAVIGAGAVLPRGTRVPAFSSVPASDTAAGEDAAFAGEGENAPLPAQDGILSGRRLEDGYVLSVREMQVCGTALPDTAFCVRFGERVGAFCKKNGMQPVFFLTEEDEALSSAENLVLEAVRCACGCPVFVFRGVCAWDAAFGTLPELPSDDAQEKDFLRLVFFLSASAQEKNRSAALFSPAVRLADGHGAPLGGKDEKKLEEMISAPLREFSGEERGTDAALYSPVEIPAARAMMRYRAACLTDGFSCPPAYRLAYRIENAAGEDALSLYGGLPKEADLRMLSGLFSSYFGLETPGAALTVSLVRDPVTGEGIPTITEEDTHGDETVPVSLRRRTFGLWELAAMSFFRCPADKAPVRRDRAYETGNGIPVPADAPLWLDAFADAAGVSLIRSARPLGLRTVTSDATALLFTVGRTLSLRGGTLSCFWAECAARAAEQKTARANAPASVRRTAESAVPASAAILRRLSDVMPESAENAGENENGWEHLFVPDAVGVVSARRDGSAVRVAQTRAHTLKITADAYSSEQAEALFSETEARLLALSGTPEEPHKTEKKD